MVGKTEVIIKTLTEYGPQIIKFNLEDIDISQQKVIGETNVKIIITGIIKKRIEN